jgi:hypothetical protein
LGHARYTAPFSGTIEVLARYCAHSPISQHKERPPGFSHAACFRNLLDTFTGEGARLTLFYDAKRGPLSAHFLSQYPSLPIHVFEEGSEAGSFLRLLDYALTLPDESAVYFLEDDYLHRPGWLQVLREGLSLPGISYVTLYDHRDKYDDPRYRNLSSRLLLSPSTHWRTTPSTTHTFACFVKTLRRDASIHRRYSSGRLISADHRKFIHLQRRGAQLVSPIPGWSSHAEPRFFSPHIHIEELSQ